MERLVAIALATAWLGTPALAQLSGTERATFVKEDIETCVSMQKFSLPRKNIPAAQYRQFCECRAEYLAQHTTPQQLKNWREKMIAPPSVPDANTNCEKKVFGRVLCRILNITILVGVGQKLVIPMSCEGVAPSDQPRGSRSASGVEMQYLRQRRESAMPAWLNATRLREIRGGSTTLEASMRSTIRTVRGFRIWDSRGRPTVEVEVTLEDGTLGRGIAPAGASRGSNEAVDLRDGGSADGGFGVSRAVGNVNGPIARALVGMDAADQSACDTRLLELDPTPNKERLGGNAMVAASMAVLDAAARNRSVPVWRHLAGDRPVRMPLPQVQIFGGGAHAGHRTDIQDFLVMPVGAATFDEALHLCADVYRAAGKLMARKGKRYGVADEGGWWPDFESNEEALQILTAAIEAAGHGGGAVKIALDIAASEFGKAGSYKLGLGGRVYSTYEWVEQLTAWIDRYPIVSVEDPVAEDDAEGMRQFTAALGQRVQVIGDDFLVTNAARVSAAVATGACNAVLLKPNQAGTLTETLAALECARHAGWSTVVSARSGETEDVLITHLAVGWNAGQLKVGAFARSERMAKWNEGLRIERSCAGLVGFAGAGALPVRVG